ncbi:MAG TPA: urea ABC transporter permease subunit UrtB, partial [Xanthobacteraceae bacterium]|nr:urea ABC transporter permease subunit UrtB [Xanthobacteraceae bacterium]
MTAMRFLSDRLVALLFVLALLGAAAGARAASFNEALTRFAADDYDETEAGIGEVAASGNPMAANVLDALQDGRLLYGADKRIFIKDPSDR